MPPTVAPLVPRTKAQKRKRPAFRPTKSPKSSASKAKKKIKKKAPVSTPTLSKEKDPELSKDKQQAEFPPPDSDEQNVAPAAAVSESQQPPPPEPETPLKTKENSIPARATRRTRKRKQSTGLVSIGSSRQPPPVESRKRATSIDTPNASTDASAGAITATASAVQHTPDESESAEASPAATAAAQEVAAEASEIPQLPPAEPVDRDQLTLQRLAEEDPDGARLTAYCSKFKKKRQQPQRKRKDNNNPGQTATATTNATETAGGNNDGTEGGPNQAQKATARSEPTGTPVVQIVNGEIVLQESSLMVPGARRTVQEVEEEFQNVVEEDAQAAIVGASYNSFVNRKGPQHWSLTETKRFYEALRQVGTDFCTMEAYFENRSRKQLKKKFQAESAKNSELVEMALQPKSRNAIDLSVFDVTVDPKAIEAAANDDVTPPEPNEAPVLATDDAAAPTATEETNQEDSSEKPPEWEVVHEEGDSRDVAEKPAQTATATSAVSKPSASIWPEVVERDDSHDVVHPTLGDDLYLPQDDRETGSATATHAATATTTEIGSTLAPATEPAPTKVSRPVEKQPVETTAISLVPTKKTKQKTKRVKFRSAAARKRKSG